MRWQKAARLAIAVFVIAFAAIVFVALLRRPSPPKLAVTTPRTRPDTQAELGAFEMFHTRENKVVFKIRGEALETYPDGRRIARRAVVTLPDRNGRTCDIAAPEMEVTPPPQGQDQSEISVGKMTGGVNMKCSDGLEMASKEALYDDKSGVINVPSDVQFSRGRMQGSGVGATYDQHRDVLWLLANAKVNVAPDEKGEGAVDATAASAGFARPDHYVRLSGAAHVVGQGRTIDADELTVQLTPDDRLITSMTLRGNSRISGSPGASGAEGMSARDIDLTYGPDGRTLQQAKLMENAVAQLSGGPGAGARKVSGRTIDMTMGPDGSTVTSLNATDSVQVDLPATPDAPARQINSTTLTASGPNGLQTATFAGGVTYRELHPAQRGDPASERTGRSLRLVVETQPGLGAIQQADFHGNVRIVDGATTAEGSRALYKVAQDSFDLTPSTGDPGPPPSVNDGRVLVHAQTITFTISTKKLHADTDVRSSMQPSKRSDDKSGSGRSGGRSNAATSSETARMPSMLKDDEPVNVTSNRLDYDGATGVATYLGNAKLFQARTRIQGDTIVLDDQSANLTARGHVSTVMFFEETDQKTKTTKLVETDATGDSLFYEDAKRLATYKTGPTAKAHIVGTEGDVTADTIQLFLKEGSNELERAEADGNVIVKEGPHTGTGTHLTYTPADESYVLTGAPVEIEEKTPTYCRITIGTTATFHRSAADMAMTGNGITPVTVKQCAKQSGGLRPPEPPYAVARGGPMPRSAPAGAPVARLVRYAARRSEYKILVASRITDKS
jgi:lipopolysaccharide export system protein LptA